MAVQQESLTGRRPRRRRAGPAIVASIALHAALFLAIGLITPRLAFRTLPAPDSLEVRLVRTTPPPTKARPSPPPVAPSVALPLPRVHQTPTPQQPVAASPLPASPPAPAPGPASGTSIAPGPLPADATPHGVGPMLRAMAACENEASVHLTPEEKVACTQRFAKAPSSGIPYIGISAEKQAAFGAQAAADERRRRIREGNMPAMVVPCDGPGSNFGTGCLPANAIVHTGSH